MNFEKRKEKLLNWRKNKDLSNLLKHKKNFETNFENLSKLKNEVEVIYDYLTY